MKLLNKKIISPTFPYENLLPSVSWVFQFSSEKYLSKKTCPYHIQYSYINLQLLLPEEIFGQKRTFSHLFLDDYCSKVFLFHTYCKIKFAIQSENLDNKDLRIIFVKICNKIKIDSVGNKHEIFLLQNLSLSLKIASCKKLYNR